MRTGVNVIESLGVDLNRFLRSIEKEGLEQKKKVQKSKSGERCETPSHYDKYPLEVIDIITLCLAPCRDPYEAYCLGNVLKYLLRYRYKDNPVKDLEKAISYIEFIRNHYKPSTTP